MTAQLRTWGYRVGEKRVRRLLRKMGLCAIFPKKKTSIPGESTEKSPYLLRCVSIERPNQVWSTDITYIRLSRGFVYLVAVMDGFSRYVLAWELSNSQDVFFCLSALEKAFRLGNPEIFNSDQGSQFTSEAFTKRLKNADISISHDGRGRVFDNIFIERLWRSVKYEQVYINEYQSVTEAWGGLDRYFDFCYQLDLLAWETVVVEVKSVETLLPVHEAQLLTYLKLGGYPVGLRLNFNVTPLRDGIVRRVNRLPE